MSGRLTVKRYARALLEAAEEAECLDEVTADVEFIDRVCNEAPEIRNFCLTPRFNHGKEVVFVKTAFIPYISPFTRRLLLAAAENGRLAAIPFLPSAVRNILELKGDTVSVVLEAAYEPEEYTVEQIKARVSKRIGKKINLKIKIVRELLGGFRIIWQNRIIDMSISGRLRKARAILK